MLVQPIPSGDGDWGRNHNEQRREERWSMEACNEYAKELRHSKHSSKAMIVICPNPCNRYYHDQSCKRKFQFSSLLPFASHALVSHAFHIISYGEHNFPEEILYSHSKRPKANLR